MRRLSPDRAAQLGDDTSDFRFAGIRQGKIERSLNAPLFVVVGRAGTYQGDLNHSMPSFLYCVRPTPSASLRYSRNLAR